MTKPTETAKAATKPTESAQDKPTAKPKGLVVAPGQSFLTKRGIIREGEAITAADLKTARDAEGKTELAKQIGKGAIVSASKASKTDDTDDGDQSAAQSGAGPSAAQITAAAAGNDAGAAAVVDATLTGSAGDVAKANDDADAKKA